MIKFSYAIHKQTKTVIPYETFLEYYRNNTNMLLSNQSLSERMEVMIKPETYFYSPIDILTSDDFEIIYDSFLSMDDIINAYYGCDMSHLPIDLKENLIKDLNKKVFME